LKLKVMRLEKGEIVGTAIGLAIMIGLLWLIAGASRIFVIGTILIVAGAVYQIVTGKWVP
jgi:hypothetical protein